MARGASANPPTSGPDEQLKNQIRVLFSYAEDRSARVSLIQSVLKKNQEHALPSDLPKDLILESKVRAGKKFEFPKQSASAAPIHLFEGSDPIRQGNPYGALSDFSNVLRSETLRMERVSGRPLSDDEIQSMEPRVSEPTGKSLPLQNDKMLINDPDHINHGDWTVVKDGKASSPKVQLDRPASPMKNESDSATLMGKINRFSSLSNLDGESNASVEELAAATSLVLATSVVDDHHHISATDVAAVNLRHFLEQFKNFLGVGINRGKSAIYF
ncbi:hypothetical protein MRB53_030585 [Persea americana]|uniref:Uncharacterized protein n=1 Tax=Persea americana TaxID=3435 RepID=A0ACC2KLZ2_PERAE|nr:hypothetical protein MRB53_030585 [Persea americana]